MRLLENVVNEIGSEERLKDHIHSGTFFRDENDGDPVIHIHGVSLIKKYSPRAT